MRQKAELGSRAWALVQRYLLLLLAFLASITVFALYFALGVSRWDQIWANIFAEAIAACWIFMAIDFFLVRQGVQLPGMETSNDLGALAEFYPHHDEVLWKDLVKRSRSLKIIVHYYNRWAREHYAEFVEFFARGGTLQLIMADPDDAATFRAVRDNFFRNLEDRELKDRIAQTEGVLREAIQQSASAKASLQVCYLPQALHYSAILSNDRHLYLSLYEQFRSKVVKSSVFHINLSRDEDLEDYWIDQLAKFTEQSRCETVGWKRSGAAAKLEAPR